jgi:type I restriction enzyme M protein
VVSLPAGIFQPYSGVKTSILLMDKTLAKKSDNILFVKISGDGYDLGAQRRANTNSDLPHALDVLNDYKTALHQNHAFESDSSLCAVVSKEDIAKNGDYNFSADRYKVQNTEGVSKFEMVELGEICDVRDGTHDSPKYHEEGFPLITSKNIVNGNIDFSSVNLISKEDLFNIEKRSKVDDGDIIMPMIGTIGNPIIVKKDREFAIKNVALIKFYENSKIDRSYLKSLLASEYFHQLLAYSSSGSTQKFISLGFIRKLELPLPPLNIQQEIVSKIESYQRIIDGAKQVVNNYKPMIEVDADWEHVKLETVCDKISDGTHFKPDYQDEGVKFLSAKNVTQKSIDWTNIKYISEKQHKELCKRVKPQRNDILLAKNGTTGVAAINDTDEEFSIYVSLGLLRPSSKIEPNYLLAVINSEVVKKQFNERLKGVGVPNLHLKEIKEVEIPLPPLSIQTEIVALIEAEQAYVNGCKALIGLMEGKIRAVIGQVWAVGKD